MTVANHKIKILQVVGAMNSGGTENWLMQVLREVDKTKYSIDFLVHSNQVFTHTNEIISLGSKIIVCPRDVGIRKYSKKLKSIFSQEHYQIVHSHLFHFDGIILKAAREAKVPLRISHSHTAENRKHNWLRKLYYRYMKKLIKKNMSIGLAASLKAAETLYGGDWQRDNRILILHCGIEVGPYTSNRANNEELKESLGFSSTDFVIGHIGRFVEAKNHRFLIDVFEQLLKIRNNSKLLLIGSGPLLEEMKNRVLKKGLVDNVVFTGEVKNVSDYLLNCIDIFVMPSLYEGLPLSGIEAQAAGVPLLLADQITHEVDINPSLISRENNQLEASEWAIEIENISRRHSKRDVDAWKVIQKSDFNIQRSVENLIKVYNMGISNYAKQ